MVRAVREARVRTPVTVLFDTNVLLDVILDRAPWAEDATVLLDMVAKGRVRGYVATG